MQAYGLKMAAFSSEDSYTEDRSSDPSSKTGEVCLPIFME